eukprot:CAMPEP_0183414332 /NCGR_PEP_ID=MMETSP0370-20130417/22324_1 /TAXON_ID=268820 /ORGANISM="Peridinium aciculiferum, Strain PAER-2" /LENGTH=154 /DNA_ID=CAMNT_0025597647 /DNA_START=46 /DNA_END=506 /DNA_ORIENTATION=-
MSSAAPATVPTARERTLALSSLAASSDWRSALILIDAAEEQDAGSRLDVINYNSAINVCGRASRWREALQLLGRLPALGLVADAASYSAAIAACAPGGAPLKKAFGLLARMRHTNVKRVGCSRLEAYSSGAPHLAMRPLAQDVISCTGHGADRP